MWVGWPNHEIYRYLQFQSGNRKQNSLLAFLDSIKNCLVTLIMVPAVLDWLLSPVCTSFILSVNKAQRGLQISSVLATIPSSLSSPTLFTLTMLIITGFTSPFTDQLCLSISLWYWHSSLLHYLLISAEMSSYKKTSSDDLVLKSLLSSSLYVYLPSLFLDVIHTQCLMSIIYSLLLSIRLGVLRQMLSCRGCYILSTRDHTVVLLHLFIY